MVSFVRHRAPEFWTPQRVPVSPVEVDWLHPLANGLVACYVPGNALGLIDLCGIGPRLVPVSGATFGPTSWGPGMISTTNGCASSTTIPSAWQLTSTISLVYACDYIGTPDATTNVWGLTFNSAVTTPFDCYVFGCGTVAGTIRLAYCNGTTAGTTANSAVLSLGPHVFAGTFSVPANTAAMWVDGVKGATNSFASAPSYTGPPMVVLNSDPVNTSLNVNMAAKIAMIYNRVLTDAEIGILNTDPFCMLRTIGRNRGSVGGQTSVPLALTGKGFFTGHGLTPAAYAALLFGKGAVQKNAGKVGASYATALSGQSTTASKGRGLPTYGASVTGAGRAKSVGQVAPTYGALVSGRGVAQTKGRVAGSYAAPLSGRGAAASDGRGLPIYGFNATGTGRAKVNAQNTPTFSAFVYGRGAAQAKGNVTGGYAALLSGSSRLGSRGKGLPVYSLPLTGVGASAGHVRAALTTAFLLAGTGRIKGSAAALGAYATALSGAGRSNVFGNTAFGSRLQLAALGLSRSAGRVSGTYQAGLASRGTARGTGQASGAYGLGLSAAGRSRTSGSGLTGSQVFLLALGGAKSRGAGSAAYAAPLSASGRTSAKGNAQPVYVLNITGTGRASGQSTVVAIYSDGTAVALTGRGSVRSGGFGSLSGTQFLQLLAQGKAGGRGRGQLNLGPIISLDLGAHGLTTGFAAGPGSGQLTLTPFRRPQRVSSIGFPRRDLPFVDLRTGVVDQTWLTFLHALWTRTGGASGPKGS